jgi:thioredoxin reductase (NADPH)
MKYTRLAVACFLLNPTLWCNQEIHSKLVILGSGPAGLTAALYTSRAQLKPIVIEGDEPGGHLTSSTYIENWPGTQKIRGLELMDNIKEHARNAGTEFLPESALSINLSEQPFTIVTTQGTKITCNAIILAMGSRPRTLHCLGESTYWGKGVATCAICDGPLYRGKDVVIVGGGDSAMEYASFMAKFAQSITIVQLLDILTASAPMQLKVLENPAIAIYYSHAVSEVRGNGTKITDIIITNVHTQEQKTIKTDGLFIAIGHSPCTSLVKGQLDLDITGHIIVNDKVKTSVQGVFAAGDIIEPLYKQAITAAGSGCMAALAAERYLMATKQHRSPSQMRRTMQ